MGSAAFVFEAGNLALDLVNTRPISGGIPQDYLQRPEQLDSWLAEAGLQEQGAVLALDEEASARLLRVARQLRDGVQRLAEEMRARERPHPAHLDAINRVLAAQRVSTRIDVFDGQYRLSAVPHTDDSAALLVPVAEAAAELVTRVAPERVRQCDDETCVLWFVDRTRNGRRRWCSMARCGNRAKVAAHYRRQKERR